MSMSMKICLFTDIYTRNTSVRLWIMKPQRNFLQRFVTISVCMTFPIPRHGSFVCRNKDYNFHWKWLQFPPNFVSLLVTWIDCWGLTEKCYCIASLFLDSKHYPPNSRSHNFKKSGLSEFLWVGGCSVLRLCGSYDAKSESSLAFCRISLLLDRISTDRVTVPDCPNVVVTKLWKKIDKDCSHDQMAVITIH